MGERIYPTPQSSDEVNLKTLHTLEDVTPAVTCDDAGTTCFVEDTSVKKNPREVIPAFDDYIVRDDTLSAFFAKPQLISIIDWTAAAAAGSNIVNFSISSRLAQPPILDKLKGFSLFRAKFVVRVEINSNPFQQGLLYLHYIPNQKDRVAVDAGFLSRVNSNIPAKIQHPGSFIYASDKSVEFEVPYVAPSLFYDVRSDRYDWGHVHLDVMLPLTTGAAGQTISELSVFGYFVDCEFVAPIIPQSGRSKVRKNTETREAKGTISSGLLAVSKAADSLSGIPMISTYAASASFVTRSLAGLASYFGFSKPRLLTEPSFMVQQPGRYTGNSTGGDFSHPLGNLSDNSVDVLDTHSVTHMDEMSFSFLKKIPHYYGSIVWTTSQVSDTTLVWDVLTTSMLRTGFTINNGTSTMSYAQNGPVWLLSNFFKHWRGSVKMHVKIAKTKFHSGKLMVAFNPGDKPTLPDNTNSVFLMRNIIDISAQDEFEIEFPYLAWQTWLETGTNVAAGNRCSGGFRISVLNSLRAPETCAQSVNLFIYFTFGDDYQFNTPCSTQDNIFPSGGVTPLVVSLQSDNQVVFSDVVARSHSTTFRLEANSKASGDVYTSVKQLLTRMTTLVVTTSAPNVTGNFGLINPWVLGTGRHSGGSVTLGAAVSDALSMLLPMYMFHRGSMRVLYKPAPTVTTFPYTTASLVTGRNSTGSSTFVSLPTTGGCPVPVGSARATLAELNLFSLSCAQELIGHNEPMYFKVPPSSQMPAFILPIDDGRVAPPALDLSVPRSYVSVTCPTDTFATASTTSFARGVADDWVSTFFLCAPPILISVS